MGDPIQKKRYILVQAAFCADLGMKEQTTALPIQLSYYADLCGWTLARAHARSGDAAMNAGFIGNSDVFDRAIGTFTRLYADQTERDYHIFTGAIRSGKIIADREN